MSKLVKDWFNRRAEDSYTFADDSKRLFNWDKNRSSYSSFFINDNDSLKNAAKMVGSMFRVINVPKNIKYANTVAAHQSSVSKPVVQIPLSMLRDENGKYLNHDSQLLDAFYGSAIQNAALATMQTNSDYYKTIAARDTTRDLTVKDMLFSVLNTERVDKKLADRFPGYLKFVQKFKNYKYETAEPIAEDAPDQARLMDLIVKLLRYPANIDEKTLEEFEKPVKAIERLLKKHGGIPETADDCLSMAASLSTIIYKYVKEEEKEEKPDSGEGDGDGETPPPDGSGPSAPSKEPDMSRKELNELAKEMVKSMVNPESETPTDDEFAESFSEFEDEMSDDAPPKMMKFDDEGDASSKSVTFEKAGSNKPRYMKAIDKIDTTKAAVLQKLFQRKSKDQAFVIKSMRSGRLDTNKIAEARQNVPTIYERMGHITTNKICVGVLIDESGSMNSSEKIDKAREAAIFINEVFKKMPDVDLYIYGHTADMKGEHSTNMRIYRERNFVSDPFALGDVSARGNNRDGDAILAAAKRIRAHTSNQGLLFVLSDGAPSAYNYNGKSAIKDTREKVTKAQALGFQVIQIAIEEHVPSSEMFDYFIKMTDIKNLPKDLISYMSRKVDKLIRETVTV